MSQCGWECVALQNIAVTLMYTWKRYPYHVGRGYTIPNLDGWSRFQASVFGIILCIFIMCRRTKYFTMRVANYIVVCSATHIQLFNGLMLLSLQWLYTQYFMRFNYITESFSKDSVWCYSRTFANKLTQLPNYNSLKVSITELRKIENQNH